MIQRGKARTRTIGWGDRAVTFDLVPWQAGGWSSSTVQAWWSSRGDRHAMVHPDDADDDSWWRVIWVGDDMGCASRGHHDSLESALYAAREWLLGGEG